ncbi:hypothetical protein AWC38_SpisGene12288 [Stylophora pistillata]|uniref:Uncharacterized protein n=1 Tax=Stylophora pistillata TaxID=50429 RepID=A0A2B4S2C8_STYPI|nr:hypothetical protein AWC38_SpisGene12288 [Stylophora pistillata]
MLKVLLFPASCGHRKVIFTGRSSVPLREIILTVDEEIPTEQDFQELKTNALPYLSDVKSALERGWRSTTDYFFAGSTVERFGIAMMILQDARCFGLAPLGSLDADLDVMFCCSGVKASFSGQDDLLVEPYISGREGFTGYAQLVYFTPSVEKAFVSSTLNRQRANSAVQNMPVDNLTSDTCCFGTIDSGPKVSFSSRGPTMRVRVAPLFEADFTICIQCFEWPPKSDWSFRPSSVNLFESEDSCFCMTTMNLLRLAKKVERIMRDPAPFIFDDGCCCLAASCRPVPHPMFTPRTIHQLSADYNEIPFSVDGHGDPPVGDHAGQSSPEFSSPRFEAHLHDKSLFEQEEVQVITSESDDFMELGACLYPTEAGDKEFFLSVWDIHLHSKIM